jgi:hypothetical protein
LYIILVSDGQQEPLISVPDGTCDGPDTTTAHPFNLAPITVTRLGSDLFATSKGGLAGAGLLVGSWQANMLDKAISGMYHPLPTDWPGAYPGSTIPTDFLPGSGPAKAFQNPNSEALTSTPAILEVDFIKNLPASTSTALALGSFGAGSGVDDGDGPAPRTLAATSAAGTGTPSGEEDFITFLSGMAMATGGRLMVPYIPEDPNGPHILQGDADDSLCVDLADFNIMRQFFGQKINPANPLSLDADVTYDGVIDDRDYLLIKANLGLGCSTPPGSMPLMSRVLFGFGDESNWWSPQDPLSATSWPKTQGAFALKVGHTGWREVNSVLLNTSLIQVQGVTPKLAFDIFIPGNPVNPGWLGQAQMYVSCPSAGLNNLSLGNVELNGKLLNQFSTVQFAVPWNVRQVMLSPHGDFSFKLVVNSGDSGHIFDNLRFVP